MNLKNTFTAAAVTAVFFLNGAPLHDDARYTLTGLPDELTASCPVGKDISFMIEEKCADGFSWQLMPQTGCEVSLKHKPGKQKWFSGSGKVEIEIEPQQSGALTLQFVYVNPADKNTAGKKLFVKLNHGTAAVPAVNPPAPAASAEKKLFPDAVYRLSDLQPETNIFHARITVGSDIDFKLEEDRPGASWEISKYNSNLFRVKLDNDDEGVWPLNFDVKEIDIKAISRGTGKVEFVYRSSGRIIKRLICNIDAI